MTTAQSKANFWREHITAWQSSSLSQAAYCQQNELKLATFTYWRNKQIKSRRKLVPVSLGVPEVLVELSLSCGIHMQVPVSTLEQVLPLVWRLLGERE